MKNPEFLALINKYLFGLALLVMLCGCSENDLLFELRTPSRSGVDFENKLTENDSLNILDYLYFYNGGGLAMGDINNDGLPDLYFSANQEQNKLYLNKGNLEFEDITQSAGVRGNSTWNTGAVMADVNGDGWLDIYVTAVVGINGFKGHNELFINNKDNTFTESAAEFGLDLATYGTTASFFDYDLDGDLDVYVLNHAVHTEESFGKVQLRYTRNEKSGDRLLRNDGNTFTDVSEEAGIYGGVNAYGLGLATSDFNRDGYPDIYVGNDFHEDDYFYLNNGDGTFTESLRKYFGHTSRFSMGNDVADINHDGLPDLISLDMSPEDEKVLKSSEGDDTYQTLEMRTQQYGYHFQYTRNMLYINQDDNPFTETALLSGIAATDWSWSALFSDFDQDGEQDLFVSNGIPKRPNDMDFIRFVSSDKIKNRANEKRLIDQSALEMMPSGAVSNYIFKGNASIGFTNKTEQWISGNPTVSGATAIGDLDGDGDLDIVTNNINQPAGLYINKTNDQARYLKIRFDYRKGNSFGIGSKVEAWNDGVLQYKELFPCRGWQASSEPIIHFGMDDILEVDSLKIIWPDNTYQVLSEVMTNQTLTISPQNSAPYSYLKPAIDPIFKKVNGNLGLNYRHQDIENNDFDYQKLIPYKVSDRGPIMMTLDSNNDSLTDVLFRGGTKAEAILFLQNKLGFTKDSSNENMPDSVDFTSPDSYSSQYFVSEDTNGDTLKFEGGYTTRYDFGNIPPSKVYYPDGKQELLEDLGMVTDAVWNDFDQDGDKDLIVVGEWMSPKFFRNNDGELIEDILTDLPLNGLWQTIIPFDIDKDGDTDYLLGNWGLNSKFTASQNAPMVMYYDDFDENGTTETVVATFKNGKYYPLMGLNELSAQMNFLRKKFTTFESFAGKTMTEIFGEEALSKATKFEVNTLASGFLRNTDNSFIFTEFPEIMQTAPIMAFECFDFNGDGKESVLAGGNYFGVIPFHGRYDSFPGALIDSETEIRSAHTVGIDLSLKSVRHLRVIRHNNQPYLLVINNNDDVDVYEIKR
ncbi:MAG: VCBS repeat-containing protein [Bacteroidia bacterium]|nr:VCBS repeat-containing protein [Bacteroidia bacterium]NNF32202.1 VCBS repeat-containing protein [Flavobacteriaceae bacterium]MBT8276665.1 VCBS repeat-containing protein [Bacteroidia bacterium]NNJ82112.1 VCBS repeat-containing protein [Flavobacteriaceae bacterium]NNK55123.1 VCBS repeat-containing protein [Flavobacteriaceae bacterium]